MSLSPALPLQDPWRILLRLGGSSVVLGVFICTRMLYQFREARTSPWSSTFFQTVLVIDLALGLLTLWSGGMLLQRRPSGIAVSVTAAGAVYANALFGFFLNLPWVYDAAINFVYHNAREQLRTASDASHFFQSGVLILYCTGVLWILLGDLRKRGLDPVCFRPALAAWAVTSASAVAAVHLLLRHLTGRLS